MLQVFHSKMTFWNDQTTFHETVLLAFLTSWEFVILIFRTFGIFGVSRQVMCSDLIKIKVSTHSFLHPGICQGMVLGFPDHLVFNNVKLSD